MRRPSRLRTSIPRWSTPPRCRAPSGRATWRPLFCILSVFIPSFIMQGAVRALFLPLSLAVGGAMVTSYLLSSTFVPVLCVWLLENRHGAHGPEGRPGFFTRMQDRFERVVSWTVAHRGVV